MKTGIIQSRGLGDIVIALPIARYYYLQGREIVWPICSEFVSSFKDSVPWVKWIGMEVDPEGRFFLETPLRILEEQGIGEELQLNLYQYLSSVPELTDPELFSILKFDQYKYWVAGVPFKSKWQLQACVTRDPAREERLKKTLKIWPGDQYAVTHLSGSNFRADLRVDWLDPAVRIIRIEDHLTDSIWDWLGVLEGASAFVGVDSVFANLVDQWGFDNLQGELYWIRRSAWDLTPVLGQSWTLVPTNLAIVKDFRVDPAAQAREKAERIRAASAKILASDLVAHAPYQASGKIPTSFLDQVKK